jgi:hypothetical protein
MATAVASTREKLLRRGCLAVVLRNWRQVKYNLMAFAVFQW